MATDIEVVSSSRLASSVLREEHPLCSAIEPPYTKTRTGREMATQTRPPPKGNNVALIMVIL